MSFPTTIPLRNSYKSAGSRLGDDFDGPENQQDHTYHQVSNMIRRPISNRRQVVQRGSPVSVSVRPKIDYDSIHIRQVEFQKKRSEWNNKTKLQETQMKRIKKHNFDLISKLKQMNLQIDELIQDAQLKAQIDAMRENDPSSVEQKYECDHQGTMERLEDLIQRKLQISTD